MGCQATEWAAPGRVAVFAELRNRRPELKASVEEVSGGWWVSETNERKEGVVIVLLL